MYVTMQPTQPIKSQFPLYYVIVLTNKLVIFKKCKFSNVHLTNNFFF